MVIEQTLSSLHHTYTFIHPHDQKWIFSKDNFDPSSWESVGKGVAEPGAASKNESA